MITQSLPGTAPSGNALWRERLYERLRGNPYPLFDFGDCVMPAAALWVGARLYTTAFRKAGLAVGDRVVIALPASAAFLQVLVAALWEGLTIAPIAAPAAPEDIERAVEAADARCAFAFANAPVTVQAATYTFCPASCEGPPVEGGVSLRETRLPRTPLIRFLMRTSGTSSPLPAQGGRLLALSDSNVLSILDSHLPELKLRESHSRVLSTLPWHHAFGLVLDLFPALFSGAQVRRVALTPGCDELEKLCAAGEEAAGETHWNTVPLLVKRLSHTERGRRFLRSLSGGIVGGAPVDKETAAFLSTTLLRAGYGQTEAGPGIALGEPGYWPGPGYMGRPIGCDTVQSGEGVLHFTGANAFLGYWNAATGLEVRHGKWINTGDIVKTISSSDDLFFLGRSDDAFKLINGRRVEAGTWETRLTEAVPGLSEALLYSPDGEHLIVAFTTNAAPPTVDDIAAVLGTSLGRRLKAVRLLPDDFWVRTAKGTRIRRACLAKLGQGENA